MPMVAMTECIMMLQIKTMMSAVKVSTFTTAVILHISLVTAR